MSHRSINTLTQILFLALAVGGANALAAQEMEPPSKGLARTIPCTSFDDDSNYPLGYEQTLDLAIQAVYLGRGGQEKETRKCYFRMAEGLTRHLVFENPNDPEPRYWYAAAMGLRAAEEGGRTQVRLAQRAHEQARLTLTIAPNHAGAQHVLGRLHAAVMRLSGFKRFVATRILGGKALSQASWETAESFLAAAARLQPEIPAHHYALATLYLDTDRPEAALEAFRRIMVCPPIHPADHQVLVSAGEMVERLHRELEA